MAIRSEELIAPQWESIDAAMRSKLVRRLAAPWPSKQAKGKASKATQQQVEKLFDSVLLSCSRCASEEEVPSLVHCSEIVFKDKDADLFPTNEKGVSRCNDCLYRMTGSTLFLLRSTLQDFSFDPSPAGLNQLLVTLWDSLDNPRHADTLARSLHYLILGGKNVDKVHDLSHTERFTSHMAFLGLMTGTLSYTSSWLYYVQHLGTSPLERVWRSGPRTMAWAELLLQPALDFAGHWRKSRVIWVLGACDEIQGRQAREGLFEDLKAFRELKVTVCLVGDGLPERPAPGAVLGVEVKGYSWDDLRQSRVPSPTMVFYHHTSLGTLDPATGETFRCLMHISHIPKPPVIVTTCRSEAEGRAERALLETVGAGLAMPKHVRNLFSGMAGNPDVDFDDNGWWIAWLGTGWSEEHRPAVMAWLATDEVFDKAREVVEQEAQQAQQEAAAEAQPAQEAAEKAAEEGEESPAAKLPSKSPAVFWGILDLKYNTERLPGDRVKVLETGDGRTSKFSGYGASIKETFQQENRLEETLQRSVLTENKKLTHDTIVDSGYGHLRPRQLPFPKEYSEDLADKIVAAFGFGEEDSCVLKLCNRTRGAGVIPVLVSELDAFLQELLMPPSDFQAWLQEQPADWARTVYAGCFAEQLRHWWSNECPIFVVEELIVSTPTEKEGQYFDGTMRVGFSLHREERRRLLAPVQKKQGADEEDEGKLGRDVLTEANKVWDEDRPYLDIFRPDLSMLRVQWLGGYWKLPIDDVCSPNLRDKVVSVAKQGTAPVPIDQLHEVYASLGDMVPRLFDAKEMSNASLLRRYGEWPEFGAFAVSRLACSMRTRDRAKSHGLMQLAQAHLARGHGVTKDLVESYIVRNFGVHHALQGNWAAAQDDFKRSVRIMPTNATARFLLGISLMELNRIEAAIAAMEQSLLLDPDFRAPYACLGMLRLRKGEFQRAVDISRAGLARHPYTRECSYNLGLASFALACLREEQAFSALWTSRPKLEPPQAPIAPVSNVKMPSVRALGPESRYEVLYSRVLVREAPLETAKVLGSAARFRPLYAVPSEVHGEAWLHLQSRACEELRLNRSDAWMLMDGKNQGLGRLVAEVPLPASTEVVVRVRHQDRPSEFVLLRTATTALISEVRQLLASEVGKTSFREPLFRKLGPDVYKCEDAEQVGACFELQVRGKASLLVPKFKGRPSAPRQAAEGRANGSEEAKSKEFGDLHGGKLGRWIHHDGGKLGLFKVVHEQVVIRSMPTVRGKMKGLVMKGDTLQGEQRDEWLLLDWDMSPQDLLEGKARWVLIDGKSLGFRMLLERVGEVPSNGKKPGSPSSAPATAATQASTNGKKPGSPASASAIPAAEAKPDPQMIAQLSSEAASDAILLELRATALEALETTKNSRTRDLLWTERDDRILLRLREPGLLQWKEEIPRDGWRVLHYRP